MPPMGALKEAATPATAPIATHLPRVKRTDVILGHHAQRRRATPSPWDIKQQDKGGHPLALRCGQPQLEQLGRAGDLGARQDRGTHGADVDHRAVASKGHVGACDHGDAHHLGT